ncbi:MAG TPA: glycosyltransferase, partial [Micromonosporaceae bacterium]|nr:glycosyltransferase [Micromonosporaceae bacterium]
LRENALVVNALQRHATVVAQLSVAEGFGLTLTEAMWKARPVVTTGVGGLAEQVVPGRHGLVLPGDGGDVAGGAARAFDRLLADPQLARHLGDAARRRVAEQFLPDRQLRRWGALLTELVAATAPDLAAPDAVAPDRATPEARS